MDSPYLGVSRSHGNLSRQIAGVILRPIISGEKPPDEPFIAHLAETYSEEMKTSELDPVDLNPCGQRELISTNAFRIRGVANEVSAIGDPFVVPLARVPLRPHSDYPVVHVFHVSPHLNRLYVAERPGMSFGTPET